jgi:hypothetical protein
MLQLWEEVAVYPTTILNSEVKLVESRIVVVIYCSCCKNAAVVEWSLEGEKEGKRPQRTNINKLNFKSPST